MSAADRVHSSHAYAWCMNVRIHRGLAMETENNKKSFYRAMISAYDFDEARSYLDAIALGTSDLLRLAAIQASVIAYCRPFIESKSGSENQSQIKINLKINKVLSEEEQAIHKQLIVWRNKAIAHSDFDYRPSSVIQESAAGYAFIAIPASHFLHQICPSRLSVMAEKFRQAILIEAMSLKTKIGEISE